MKRNALSIAILLGLSSTALAGPREDLAKVYRDTAASATPNMTFFNGLAALGNFSASEEDMAAVQAAAKLPEGGILGAFLTGIETMSKSGDRLTLVRSNGVGVVVPGGYIELKSTIKFRISQRTNEVKIDKVDGARVGERSSKTYPLRSVRFERKGHKTWAHINAGYAFGLNKTESVVVIDTTPQPEAAGISQAVSSANDDD